MSETFFSEDIPRREMIKRSAIFASGLALLPYLSACTANVSVADLSARIRAFGDETMTGENQKLLELVRQASLAASGHNMQPWIFEIAGQSISIMPDYTRQLKVVDPDDRELWISLGCALENLAIAAHAAGYAVEEALFTDGQERLTVNLIQDGQASDTDLAAAIPLRQCTRAGYDMRFVPSEVLETLQSVGTSGAAKAQFILDAEQTAALQDLVQEGNIQQYQDQAFVDELVDCLRFNEKEALRTRDGLYSACSGSPKVPRFIGKMFVTMGYGKQQAEIDHERIDSSSGLMLICTENDDLLDWVQAGRLYQRLALQMTNMNIKHAFMNQPIEVAELREQVQGLSFVGGKTPQLLLRYGYGESMPYSLRRPVTEIVNV